MTLEAKLSHCQNFRQRTLGHKSPSAILLQSAALMETSVRQNGGDGTGSERKYTLGKSVFCPVTVDQTSDSEIVQQTDSEENGVHKAHMVLDSRSHEHLQETYRGLQDIHRTTRWHPTCLHCSGVRICNQKNENSKCAAYLGNRRSVPERTEVMIIFWSTAALQGRWRGFVFSWWHYETSRTHHEKPGHCRRVCFAEDRKHPCYQVLWLAGYSGHFSNTKRDV